MEFWLVIFLSIIAVVAISLLIFLELMGDEILITKKQKHKRGKYINDQTAVICQTIKDTEDSRKAFNVFIEYMFTNHRQFIEYVEEILSDISKAYYAEKFSDLEQCITDAKEMKIELKDQNEAQNQCLETIEDVYYIEALSWIYLANNTRFKINEYLYRLASVCIRYKSKYSEPFPELYNEQLEALVADISVICKTAVNLIGMPDVEPMRELRKNMEVILAESYSNAQRLYEHIHDGRTDVEPEKRIALQYAINSFQICHGIIYSLRRFLLANICLSLSLQNNNKDV
ncbi:MAG: hypothetical protein K2G85_05845 [Muribaculaceae bacterium]|nr:hypothetical protein [Muribaculaceae bacterium]